MDIGPFEVNSIVCGDCLEVMPQLPDKCFDMILCDLPYGTTACKWDTIIPFKPLWEQYKRIIKDRGAIVLTASQPFTSALVMSNVKWFKYEWIWEKSKATGHALSKIRPMKSHENILVFCNGVETYNPQKVDGKPYISPYSKIGNVYAKKQNAAFNTGSVRYDNINGKRFPRTNLKFKNAYYTDGNLHPTQKPVALFEYLIKTYTNENDIVLDNCIGSGTTAIAAENLGRRWIGIELDPKYVGLANERVDRNRMVCGQEGIRLRGVGETKVGPKQLSLLDERNE